MAEFWHTTGCPIAVVAIDVPSSESALTKACAAAFESWAGIVSARLREAGVPEEKASSLATTVLACFEGALLLSRSRRDVAPMHEAARNKPALLDVAAPGRD